MQCLILAGGLGTRMRPIAGDLPKSLIPVHGRPFLDYQLMWLAKNGVKHAVLCLGYGAAPIRAFAGEGHRWGLQLDYLDEGPALKGTGGALRLALDSGLLEEQFLLMYGDSFLPIDFSSVWNSFQKRTEPALMTVLKNEQQWGPGNAQFDGHKVTCYDKRAAGSSEFRYIDYGLSVFRGSLMKPRLTGLLPLDLSDAFHNLSLRGELAGLEVFERFYEIGSPEGLAEFAAAVPTLHL